MQDDSSRKPERRRYDRVVYAPAARPGFSIADDRHEVLDITQSGIRLQSDTTMPVGSQLEGTLTLMAGGKLAVTARVEWQEGDNVGLSLQRLLPAAVIEREQRFIILQDR